MNNFGKFEKAGRYSVDSATVLPPFVYNRPLYNSETHVGYLLYSIILYVGNSLLIFFRVIFYSIKITKTVDGGAAGCRQCPVGMKVEG